ncbi:MULTISPECIES: SGNH/GDSL hydrolase family protein [Streptomyces]|uniref:SGNH/GDSL hydrolase family protein n=1 Tax=Streptomyces lycii TaxID=2654337 RepID=A0ABQ7FLK4_9ACTN|nr:MULTISPECIES: SGNH/GDSL hydrolase family protein [Streptomyces]KAF4409824.1 SGNH/GDSL hydrolase family protein [Streptomyces lycii]PGH47864.1 G-D-S-L family lipolytic protein [Streptomyces sp. Ru87]
MPKAGRVRVTPAGSGFRTGPAGAVAVVVLALIAALTPSAAAARDRAPGGPAPLHRLFDNVATGDDADPGRADFDGAGGSLSAQDLAAAGWTPGRTLSLDAARLTWPRSAPGTPDNVRADGQPVRLHGRGDAVTFLVAGTGGTATGTGTVRYRGGATSTFTLTAPDWRTGPLGTKALALPHVNTPDGQLDESARLYAVSVPADRRRTVESVVLPRDPGPRTDLHVFAASVREPSDGWTGSWAASTGGYTEVGPWTDRTLRLVVHTSAGGPGVRIRLDNTFAAGPVRIGSATVALQDSGAGAAGEPVPLAFAGRSGAEIPAGAQLWSDPLDFSVPANTNLLVSFHLPGPVLAAPVHTKALQRSFLSTPGSGDRSGDADGSAFTETLTTYPFLTGVDVRGGPGSVVALGDSITDGNTSTVDGNRRWPNVLAQRLQRQHEVPRYGVLNHGISANRVVTDRYPGDGVSTDTGGVSAQHRLERDVLAQTGVRTVVVFEGINDVRWGTSPEQVTAGLRAIAERARERGLKVVAATVAPCEGYPDCSPEVDARRTAVNAFIREHSGPGEVFDAMLDFDAVIRDPERPSRMLPAYDSGDHLHPGDAGLRALAESVDLRKLVP